MITVTKTFFPPLAEYYALVQQIWDQSQVTNNGPLVLKLEAALRHYLGVKHVLYVSNRTLALQLAIRALGLSGDIITTPFSYVATTSSIVWENCRPVFVDIEPHSLCLDPALIEAAITPATQAILATHVFGFPCAVEAIEQVARQYNLRVIYDAAHAFGVQYQGQSVLHYGDISTLSFHATKLFHTGEGGAVVTDDDELAYKVAYMRNFGHEDANTFVGLGINAKNTELHAALGLCVLPYVPALMKRRQELTDLYNQLLAPYAVQCLSVSAGVASNFSYYPILLPSEKHLLAVMDALSQVAIHPRRYFYPALTALPYVAPSDPCPIAQDVASRVLCLPLHQELLAADIEQIVRIVGHHVEEVQLCV